MEVEFQKDMHHSYMIIAKESGINPEQYSIKLLQYQQIQGLLSMDKRIFDQNNLFYYDITGKQALSNVLEKSAISYEQLKRLLLEVVDIIERSYEFLLVEDDFILTPEHLFVEVPKMMPYICYLPGYHKSMKEQICDLIEFLMNKVDYNNKEAVLMIYQLYSLVKRESYTLDQVREGLLHSNRQLPVGGSKISKYLNSEEVNGVEKQVLTKEERKQNKDMTGNKSMTGNKGMTGKKGMTWNKDMTGDQGMISDKDMIKNIDIGDDIREKKGELRNNKAIIMNKKHRMIPFMMEKVTGEEEVTYYPVRTYSCTVLCGLGGGVLVALSIWTKMIYIPFGNRIDVSKLFALLLVILCVEGYLMSKIWDKKHKMSKIVSKKEYIDPREKIERDDEAGIQEQLPSVQKEQVMISPNLNTEDEEQEISATCILNEEQNPTVLLTIEEKAKKIFLRARDNRYEDIEVKEFPFFIGKLGTNVDYCLERDVVSRYHAKITKEEEHYYITDLNSTNGTFVNQEALGTYQTREIINGNEIALANIKYEVVIY